MTRLKVFVFDQLGSRRMRARRTPQSLRRQDGMLLQALVADLGALPDVEIVKVADIGATRPKSGKEMDKVEHPAGVGADVEASAVASSMAAACAAETGRQTTAAAGAGAAAAAAVAKTVEHADDLEDLDDCAAQLGARFATGVQSADAVWPVLSLPGRTLERLSRGVLRGKRILLGSAPGAVEVAGSKLKLARVLADGGVASVATYSPHAPLPDDGGPWVVKPDDGAGCLDTRLFKDRATALAWIRASAADGFVLQPFVSGKLGSMSLLCCDGVARVLACNLERVAMRDNRFHFLGSVVNGLSDEDGALAHLAQQVAAAIPSLWGYVGVDFVLTAHGAVVLDVNPRLTAAYAGLHASIGCNPAGLVLDLLKGADAFRGTIGMRRAVSVDLGLP